MRAVVVNIALTSISVFLVLVVVEVASRFIFPVSPGVRTVSLTGEPIETIMANGYRHRAGLQFRQLSDEFDARVTIDQFGNRIPEPLDSPDIIFLGDSFTFGHGLNDDETFAFIYCAQTGDSCANLGRSGSGTLVQVGVLKHYLETEKWRPRKVKLFVLAMTAHLASGNDLLDNYYFRRVKEVKAEAVDENAALRATQSVKAPFHIDIWLRLRRWSLAHLNMARLVYFRFAPALRLALATSPSEETLELALEATREAFHGIRALGVEYGFNLSIYIVHPVQDIAGGTDEETTAMIRGISGGLDIVSTATLFKENPKRYYFGFDGHLNTQGARRIADFLVSTR